MADTSKLEIVTGYVLDKLSEEFGTKLKPKQLTIGKSKAKRKFSGVSEDNNIILFICHHSGKTSGGNIPSAKLDGLYAKCYFLEKAIAERKYIYFTNKEFYEIFSNQSKDVISKEIELKYFENLPLKYQEILNKVLKNASKEMKIS